jgi:hypothetical protein
MTDDEAIAHREEKALKLKRKLSAQPDMFLSRLEMQEKTRKLKEEKRMEQRS